MAHKRNIRFENLKICMTKEEYQKVKDAYAATTCRSLSEYLRKLIFRKRITVSYRNRAFDEFIEVGIRLKKALVLFCEQGGSDEQERMRLVRDVEDIKLILIKISEICLQK